MMVGVVSDTHLPRFGAALPEPLVEGLLGAHVGLILHLGDFTSPDVAAMFEAIAPFDAVAGNNDGEAIVRRFGRRKVLDLEGVRIGMVHGDAGPGRSTPERAWRAFADEAVDAVLFGHSHIPLCERREGALLVNPGSPTDKRRQADYSYGLLDLSGGRVEAALRFFAVSRPRGRPTS